MAILDKYFHNVLIGNNFMSCILGIGLLKANKKILLIDDQQLEYGELYMSSFGEVEKNFLEVLGQDEELAPLLNLSSYLEVTPLRMCVEQKQIFLGQDRPWKNLVELSRKLPELFGEEGVDYCQNILNDESGAQDFDELFFSTCSRMATTAVRVDGATELNFQVFLNQFPEKMKDLFMAFKSHSTNPRMLGHFYLWSSYYQQRITQEFSDVEVLHLFLSLLGPRYRLDQKSLNEDLLEICQELGGQFKSTSVRDWKFHKSAPWCIELASFDGIVHPQHLSFFCPGFQKMPFFLEETSQQYKGLNLTWSFDPKVLSRLKGQSIMGTGLKDLGTDFPWWMAQFYEDRVELMVPILDAPGTKLKFVTRALSLKLQDWLFPWLGESVSKPESESFKISSEVMSYGASKSKTQSVSLLDLTRARSQQSLKNVHYYGPLGKSPMGLFSGLLAIKEAKNFA